MLGKFNLFKKTLNMNMNMNMNICFKKFSEKVNLRKDYYQILGVPKSATEEEIKKAYRELAKIYHPDVSISSGSETKTPSIDKFREIAEAYAVLSNKTFRLDYDTRMRHFPDMVYNAEKLKKMKENENERDKTGNVTKQAPMKGSYAEYRLEKLKQIRKEFNVDQYGSYKGGVPRQDNGPMRGNSYGIPGMHHDPWFHNEKIHDTPHVRDHVSTKEAVDHKLFMNPSRQGYQRFRPYFKMDEIEKDENYYVDSEHRRLFWLPIFLIGSCLIYYYYQRYLHNKKFNHFEAKVADLKSYEYLQHGPILIYAPQRKFMQKYLSREEYHDWIDNDIRTFG